MGEQLLGEGMIEIVGKQSHKPFSPQRKGRSERSPIMTPASCKIVWPGRQDWSEECNVWLDASLGMPDVGRQFSCQLMAYEGVYEGKPYVQYTAKQLVDIKTGAQLPHPSSAPSAAPRTAPPPAPKTPNVASAPNVISPHARKRAVVLMHIDALADAKDMLAASKIHGNDLVVGIARSLVTGWCVNGNLFGDYVARATREKEGAEPPAQATPPAPPPPPPPKEEAHVDELPPDTDIPF